MKRFTETNKWSDPWYRRLSSPAKQLWEYLCDHCDLVGVVDVDYELTSQDCGQKITETNMAELTDRVQHIHGNKYLLPKFVHFQYGELSPNCPPHRSVLKLLKAYGMVREGLAYRYPKPTLTLANGYPQDKTRQDKTGTEKDCTGGAGDLDVELPHNFPLTVDDAINQAAAAGVPKEFIMKTYDKARFRGGKDSKEVPILSWVYYVKCEWNYEVNRNAERNSKPNPRNSGQATNPSEFGRKIADKIKRDNAAR